MQTRQYRGILRAVFYASMRPKARYQHTSHRWTMAHNVEAHKRMTWVYMASHPGGAIATSGPLAHYKSHVRGHFKFGIRHRLRRSSSGPALTDEEVSPPVCTTIHSFAATLATTCQDQACSISRPSIPFMPPRKWIQGCYV